MIYIPLDGVNTLEQLYLKLHDVFVYDLGLFNYIKCDDKHKDELERVKNSLNLVEFINFLIKFFNQKHFELKDEKFKAMGADGNLKFFICLCNTTFIMDND